MIKFSIPIVEENTLAAVKTGNIDEIYGSFYPDGVGSGFLGFSQPALSRRESAGLLSKLKSKGLKFNYLMDSTCLGNLELTINGQKKIRRLILWLIDNGIDRVTVSIPYLMEFIKYNYPKLKVYVSVSAGVDSFERAEYWCSLGADRITLSAVSGLNRNFKLLARIRGGVKSELELIANLSCLNDCPFWMYHSACISHFSLDPTQEKETGYLPSCSYLKSKDPVEFVRSGWIRPEDLSYYEEMGINNLKLVNPGGSRQATVLKAYFNRGYEGNLMDLLSKSPGDPGLYIDNKKLGGFLDYFRQGGCDLGSCRTCSYCGNFFAKTAKN